VAAEVVVAAAAGDEVEALGAVVAAALWFAAVAVVTVEATAEGMATVLAACSAPSMAGWSVTNPRQPDTSDVRTRA
jgi:hypothetical protein